MNLILTILIICIISAISPLITDKIRQLIEINKIRKKSSNFNIEDFDISKTDKQFWNDLEEDDINDEKN